MENNNLALKYRPASLDEVIGHKTLISSIKSIIVDSKLPAAILLSGPSGCGKTSIARALGHEIGCLDANIIEINGADYTSIDDMRLIAEGLRYKPLSGGSRVVIIDEAHRLSRAAFDSLLKNIEEPPEGSSWIFCSTEPEKIPYTIVNRCHHYKLSKVNVTDINSLLKRIANLEKISCNKDIIDYLSIKADGSPRRALVMLSMAKTSTTLNEVKDLLKEVDLDNQSVGFIAFCKALRNSKTIDPAIDALKEMQDEENEGIRLRVLAYFSKILLSKPQDAQRILKVLYRFGEPFRSSEKMAPVLVAAAFVILE